MGVGREAVVLHLAHQRAGCQTGNGFDHRRRAQLGQTVMQAAAGVFTRDRGKGLEQHGAGVQTGLHAHHGHAAFAVARFNCPLDRRRTAPAWQQRSVAVDTAQTRNIEHGLRQDQAIGHDHHQIRLERGQFGLGLRRTQSGRLHDSNRVFQRELLDRAWHQLLPAPGRTIRLGVNRDDLVRAVEQCLEVFSGEFWGAGKDDAQWLSHGLLTWNGGMRGNNPGNYR